jgi:dephospho-CoA kinase
MIHEFPKDGIKSLIIYVDASADTRFARLTARNRSGEAATTREQFDELNRQPNEITIPDIGARADIRLANDYARIADFEKEVDAAYEATIKPLLL